MYDVRAEESRPFFSHQVGNLLLGIFRPKCGVPRADPGEQRLQNAWLVFTLEGCPDLNPKAFLVVKAPARNTVLLELASVLVLLGPAGDFAHLADDVFPGAEPLEVQATLDWSLGGDHCVDELRLIAQCTAIDDERLLRNRKG
ncbi:hypothetical protein D3C78_552540 [compost metagenome]